VLNNKLTYFAFQNANTMLFKMKKFPLALIIIVFILFGFSRCEIINPSEDIPSYIRVDSFILENNPSILNEGTLSENITDVWVYIDNQAIGAFELPAIFPVLLTGEHEISFFPGIKISGISNARGIYPYLKASTFNASLYPDSIINLTPKAVTQYHDETVFEFIEDFEDPGIVFEKGTSSDTGIYRTSDPQELFEGSYSGIIEMDPNRPNVEVSTVTAYDLPQGYYSVFLELNYKCNHEFIVGLYANSFTNVIKQDILIINRTDKWKKIYVNLTATVSRYSTAEDYTIYLRAQKLDDVAEPKILVDNIKLVHIVN
jgi:hypothetical protein